MSVAPTQPDNTNLASEFAGDSASLPDDLPPVQPPSAGFIVQLFLVPGLIVLVVVGVWALFGRMAASEQDWQVLVKEIENPNAHRRWRGAMGLAQMLTVDQKRGEDGQQLATNPDVAQALADLMKAELETKSNDDASVKQQAFLARTLGMLDVPDIVLPMLQQAMNPETDADERIDLRKNAIGAVAVIAGRAAELDQQDGDEYPGRRLRGLAARQSLIDDLVKVSYDENALIRQIGTFTLGLLPNEESADRLEVLLGHADERTQINAAIALSRQNSTKGIAVFKTQLLAAAERDPAETWKIPEEVSASRYLWVGVNAAFLLLTAVWAFGTTNRRSRFIAAVLCVAAISGLSWGIFDIVKNSPNANEENVAGQSGDDAASLRERRKAARATRLEQVVVLRNCLKAVADLNDQWSSEERAELLALVERVVENTKQHSNDPIRDEAAKAVIALKTAPAGS